MILLYGYTVAFTLAKYFIKNKKNASQKLLLHNVSLEIEADFE